jgi:hypothetical protein
MGLRIWSGLCIQCLTVAENTYAYITISSRSEGACLVSLYQPDTYSRGFKVSVNKYGQPSLFHKYGLIYCR